MIHCEREGRCTAGCNISAAGLNTFVTAVLNHLVHVAVSTPVLVTVCQYSDFIVFSILILILGKSR